MSGEIYESEILIVGAGMAGLMAGRALRAAGRPALLVDKGRSVGGRLATRRIGGGLADHGAQFFTARTPGFQALVSEWLADGLAFEWARGWSQGSVQHAASQEAPPDDGHPRYAVRGGMNELAHHLAQGLTIHTGVQVAAITPHDDDWLVYDSTGHIYRAGALILTPPVPQSLALLDVGGTPLAPEDRAALERITYAPCLCGLFHLDSDAGLPYPGAIQRPGAPVAWVADNRRKGISTEPIVTVHAGPELSAALFERPDETVREALEAGLRLYLDAARAAEASAPPTQIREVQIKRWRYAQPTRLHPEQGLRAAGLPPLIFAGDAFGSPRVEGAALSGLWAAGALGTPRRLR
ncbi:MAG: FAD-dependent oxidoreductase [Anaerolineae bacterium]